MRNNGQLWKKEIERAGIRLQQFIRRFHAVGGHSKYFWFFVNLKKWISIKNFYLNWIFGQGTDKSSSEWWMEIVQPL